MPKVLVIDDSRVKLPTHTKCPHCKHEMRMGAYCYAHWDIVLTATCEACKKQYSIRRGKVIGKL